jgi:acyl-homoserine lactone acylase PvdQ
MSPEFADYLAAQASEKVQNWIGEARANERRSLRRARYWMTALAVCTRVTKLREYADKITQEEVEWLAADPQIGEAIANMQALARELNGLAAALTEQVRQKDQSAGNGMNSEERAA